MEMVTIDCIKKTIMEKGSLLQYYQTFFPTTQICKWLTCNNKFELSSRKFAMGTIHYKRVLIEDVESLQEYIEEHCPNTFQITPVLTTHERPLFFEVDLDDYHEPISANRPKHIPPVKRSCQCKSRECCDICWVEIARAPLARCIDFCRSFMCFAHVVPLFSGGRGFWIIINDSQVWYWDTETRSSFVKRIPAIVDSTVTLQKNHLMKIPLTPHHRTGNLCIPIKDAAVFVPSMAPHYSDINEFHEDLIQEWTEILY